MNSEYSKIVRTYEKVEKDALAETDNPHELVSIMFQALIKSMSLYLDNVDIKTADIDKRSKHFARSLTIIYGLQSSLDFEKGGELATNLFQTYEFARQKLIESIKSMKGDQVEKAIKLLVEISEAWDQIGVGANNEKRNKKAIPASQ